MPPTVLEGTPHLATIPDIFLKHLDKNRTNLQSWGRQPRLKLLSSTKVNN